MLMVTRLQQANNRTGGKRRTAEKDKGKKRDSFSRVLDEKLQVSPAKPTKN